jgi:hypothetical protein
MFLRERSGQHSTRDRGGAVPFLNRNAVDRVCHALRQPHGE